MLNSNQYPYVVVTCTGVINDFPPAVSLVSNLLEIGCRVSLLACGDDSCLSHSVRDNKRFEFVCLGKQGGLTFQKNLDALQSSSCDTFIPILEKRRNRYRLDDYGY